MNAGILKLLIVLFCLLSVGLGFYSKNYRKCQLDSNTTNFGAFKMERVPEYGVDYNFTQHTDITKPLQYRNFDFIYLEYIGAGGSGQVYRVENLQNNQVRVVKRFFKQKRLEFQEENYIMNMMNYDVKWHREDNNPNKSTLASYPSRESVVLSDVEVFQVEDFAVIFYKICRELDKAHRRGLIHDDIKMGNILINSVGESLRTIQVQLIDWNLASFYSYGYSSTMKKGTVCYYPPEALLRTLFTTPAIDVWALAVVYFSFITTKKPFAVDCKQSNFEAVLTLVGSERFLKVYNKYHKTNSNQNTLINQIKQNPKLYQGFSVGNRIPTASAKFFDAQFIDLFDKMLEPDPEYRLTITEVLNHPYFDRIKRLPKMYFKKNEQKLKDKNEGQPQRQRPIPADNLVPAQPPIQQQ